MSLYHRHRPSSFDEVIGNEETKLSLQCELQKKDRGHCFLFHGQSGTGKTTFARIIANEVGAFGMDFKEMDSAQFRGIDTIRKIREDAMFSPFESRSKSILWLLDECHKLTTDAMPALLKILEDPPGHVYFVLCTTEPGKLIKEIRGRCLEYQTQLLSDVQMKRLLRRVVKKEQGELSEDVYEQIIRDSLGAPRNALQILDQVISLPKDKQLAMAKRTAETQSKVIELCRALMSPHAKWGEVSEILSGLGDENIEQMRWAVLGYSKTALLRGVPKAANIIDQFSEPFFNSAMPGFILACYYVVTG